MSKITVITGPYGTGLESKFGVGSPQTHPAAVLDPQVAQAIQEIGTQYVRAGAQKVLPHTFGSRIALRQGDPAAYKKLVGAQVDISRRVIDSTGKGELEYIPFGPHGECYDTTPLSNPDETVTFHSRQIAEAATHDLTAIFEATARREEIFSIAAAAEKLGQQVIVGLVLGKNGNLLDGTTLNDALEIGEGSSIQGFVLNCGPLPGITRALHGLSNRHLSRVAGLYPNATADLDAALASGGIVGPQNAEADARQILELAKRLPGQNKLVSGCCGHGPESIGVLAKLAQQQIAGVFGGAEL